MNLEIALKVIEKEGGLFCHYCKRQLSSKWNDKNGIVFDHVIPKLKGGKTEIENLVLSCKSCNSAKGGKDYDLFLKWRKIKDLVPEAKITLTNEYIAIRIETKNFGKLKKVVDKISQEI